MLFVLKLPADGKYIPNSAGQATATKSRYSCDTFDEKHLFANRFITSQQADAMDHFPKDFSQFCSLFPSIRRSLVPNSGHYLSSNSEYLI